MPGPLWFSRRTLLRGLGTAIALPLLDQMSPLSQAGEDAAAESSPKSLAGSQEKSQAGSPLRMGFIYIPNGANMADWIPSGTGKRFELSPALLPLAPHRDYLTVLTGLANTGAMHPDEACMGHARAVSAYLTCVPRKKSDGSGIRNGQSVDQFAAERFGKRTRFSSLELGNESEAAHADGCASLYNAHISWRSPTQPLAKEHDPLKAFDRLFGAGDPAEQQAARDRRTRLKKSVLDAVADDAASLQAKLGASDRRKLDEYLHSVRDAERRLVAPPVSREAALDFARPGEVPKAFEDRCKLMFDVLALAIQADLTRIFTFLVLNGQNNMHYKELGADRGHHELSHHENRRDWQAILTRINRFHVSLLCRFLEKLKNTPEGEGNLLDHSLFTYGGGLSDGNKHNNDNLPTLLLGKGCGSVPGNRHLAYAGGTPLANLWLAMLQRFGISESRFVDSTGPLNLEG